MGCISSKHFKKELKREFLLGNSSVKSSQHLVSLTSSTYGVLNIDNKEKPTKDFLQKPSSHPEIINAWELMKDLDEEIPFSIQAKKSPKSSEFFRSPLKLMNRSSSPKGLKRVFGKENVKQSGNMPDCSPKGVLKSSHFPTNLHKSYERELSEDGGVQIKNMVTPGPKPRKKTLGKLEGRCPPAGENSVVIYTTTLRGIRKTFEDCNTVRSILESHGLCYFERDISMDCGLKEELKGLLRGKMRVPVMFVRGRLVGGANEVLKLEEEGSLEILIDGIPKASALGCRGCGGIRFVMCFKCSGSRKVADEFDYRKNVKCGECNENGLILCPICS